MKEEYKEFIGIYKDIFPEQFNERVIDIFNEYEDRLLVNSREEWSHDKNDLSLDLNVLANFRRIDESAEIYNEFYKGLKYCFMSYRKKYSILTGYNISAHNLKIQKTGAGGGYHIWHPEKIGPYNMNRILVFNYYCNTLDDNDGGETEFLYQKLRFKPVSNTMLIFPADFTHAHRGNMVLGETNKYIITGWFYVHNYLE